MSAQPLTHLQEVQPVAAQIVDVSLAQLLRPELTPCTKLIAIGLEMDKHLDEKERCSPSRLHRRLGPARTTIRRALAALAGSYCPSIPPGLILLFRLVVPVQEALITDKSIPALARVLYCILLGLHQLRRYDILSSYKDIADVVHLQARTVRRAVHILEQAGWLAISQKHKYAPIRFSFPDPFGAKQRAEVRRAQQQLEKSGAVGETLARVWCDTLVAPSKYEDDSYPEFLTNPETNELLQADRYYVDHNVIIEFQGPQHDGATERFSEETAQAQMERDRIKREICARHKVPLIELRPEDLTFHRLQELLGAYLPLQERSIDEPIIQYLETESRRYQEIIANIRRRSGQVV